MEVNYNYICFIVQVSKVIYIGIIIFIDDVIVGFVIFIWIIGIFIDVYKIYIYLFIYFFKIL